MNGVLKKDQENKRLSLAEAIDIRFLLGYDGVSNL